MSQFNDDQFKQSQLNLNVSFNVLPKTRFQKYFPEYQTGFVCSEPGKFILTSTYGQNAEKIYRFAPRNDDVWILSFPKCGTTWSSELLWLLVNDCNIEKAKSVLLSVRVPFIEMPCLLPDSDKIPLDILNGLEIAESMPSPRVLKSHLPFYLLHPKLLDTSKVVYVARNPKDAIVSFFYHHKLMKRQGFTGTVDEFAEYFMENEAIYTPFFPHVLDAWSKRDHPNMHFIFYEDMKKDLRGEIEKVAAFLNKSPTKEQLAQITEHLKFDNFEKNEAVNNESGKKIGLMNEDGKFLRKGITGDWKNHFSPEMNARLDSWIADHLSGTDLKFVMELGHQD